VKRKRQFEEGKNDQVTAKDVREKEKGQPQIAIYQIGEIEYADNSGSKRRRVHEEKGDCITMFNVAVNDSDNQRSKRAIFNVAVNDSDNQRSNEKTKRKAGENTMMERLEGDEAIE